MKSVKFKELETALKSLGIDKAMLKRMLIEEGKTKYNLEQEKMFD